MNLLLHHYRHHFFIIALATIIEVRVSLVECPGPERKLVNPSLSASVIFIIIITAFVIVQIDIESSVRHDIWEM